MAKPKKCGDRMVTTDDRGPALDLTCDRSGRTHLVHKDATGNRFVRTPGGALVSGPKQQKRR